MSKPKFDRNVADSFTQIITEMAWKKAPKMAVGGFSKNQLDVYIREDSDPDRKGESVYLSIGLRDVSDDEQADRVADVAQTLGEIRGASMAGRGKPGEYSPQLHHVIKFPTLLDLGMALKTLDKNVDLSSLAKETEAKRA